MGTDQGSAPRPGFCGASTNIKERPGQSVMESDARAQYRRVEVWVVPAGADLPDALKNAKEAPSAAISRLGCPR